MSRLSCGGMARAQGELIGAARTVLRHYMHNTDETNLASSIGDEAVGELRRLVHNAFGFHGNDIGDPVQLSLLILLMVGEEHIASDAGK